MVDRVTVGEAARRAGLTPKAVRFYEAKGVLASPGRSASGYRLYTVDDVRTLRFVRRARELGVGLARIKAILASRRGNAGGADGALAAVEAHLAELDHDALVLDARRGEVSAILAWARAAAARGEQVRICRLLGADDGECCPSDAATRRAEGQGAPE